MRPSPQADRARQIRCAGNQEDRGAGLRAHRATQDVAVQEGQWELFGNIISAETGS
jgi:hypothetical protein